jgi:hypothetical protein
MTPLQRWKKPKLPVKVKPALTPDEVEQVLHACEGKHWLQQRDKALCLLLLDTGLRIHEAHKLTVADAKQEVLLIRGKGGKQRVVFLSAEVRLAHQAVSQSVPLPANRRLASLARRERNTDLARAEKRGQSDWQASRTETPTWRTHLQENLRHLEPAEWNRPRTPAATHGAQLTTRYLRQYLALVEADLKQAHQQHSPLRNLRKR